MDKMLKNKKETFPAQKPYAWHCQKAGWAREMALGG